MKILFYGTKNYDEEFFEKLLPSYPGITIKFTEANIHEETGANKPYIHLGTGKGNMAVPYEFLEAMKISSSF